MTRLAVGVPREHTIGTADTLTGCRNEGCAHEAPRYEPCSVLWIYLRCDTH